MNARSRTDEQHAFDREAQIHKDYAEQYAKDQKFEQAFAELKQAYAAREKALDDTLTPSGLRLLARGYIDDAHKFYTYYLEAKNAHSSHRDTYMARVVDNCQAAIECFEALSKKFIKTIDDCRHIGSCYMTLGELSFERKQYSNARRQYQNAIKEISMVPVEHRIVSDEKILATSNKGFEASMSREYRAQNGFFKAAARSMGLIHDQSNLAPNRR